MLAPMPDQSPNLIKAMIPTKHPTVEERRALGKSRREEVPRRSHGEWAPGPDRPDPIQLLEEQNEARLDFLVPVRRSRMAASAFAFFRGGARIMASDLARTPVSGLTVQACGDAHLANFGLFASPERSLVFDLNDFDETLAGPWEWDLKRLATSFTIAARHNGLGSGKCRKLTELVGRCYREAMRDFSEMRTTDLWYALTSEEDYLRLADRHDIGKRARRTISKAKRKNSSHALDRLAEVVDGEYRIKHEPPLLIPLREMRHEQRGQRGQRGQLETVVRESYQAYLESVSPDCRVLLDHYKPVDSAMKVVGVGSVGTRCWILLLEGRDRKDPLFLQIKEASTSVLAEHLPPSPYEKHGRRVVEGQRLMQTANDIFLGWTRTAATGRDFYWRQLRDWKGAVDVGDLDLEALTSYARGCAWTLARAHARSGDPLAIAAYLGSGRNFDQALAEFAVRYADQSERDYETFRDEVQSGRLEATKEA
jgi:uncharacterized protein (DUF2252 family)